MSLRKLKLIMLINLKVLPVTFRRLTALREFVLQHLEIEELPSFAGFESLEVLRIS